MASKRACTPSSRSQVKTAITTRLPIAAPPEPDLIQHPAGGVAVDLGLAGNHIAEPRAEDVVGRTFLSTNPLASVPNQGGPSALKEAAVIEWAGGLGGPELAREILNHRRMRANTSQPRYSR